MRNISPSHAMINQSRRIMISGFLLLLGGFVLLALWLLLVVVPLSRADWYAVVKLAALIIGGLLGIAGGIQLFRAMTFPKDNPHAVRMAGFLSRFLDYRYTFIRNVGRRGLGYVDAILIGPNGALIFYFFKEKGAFYSERNLWFEQSGRSLKPFRLNPTQEAVKDVNALRAFLEERKLGDMPVYAVIVVVDPNTAVTVQQPVVPVAHMPNVQMALRDNYLAQERVTPNQAVGAVKAIMEGLA